MKKQIKIIFTLFILFFASFLTMPVSLDILHCFNPDSITALLAFLSQGIWGYAIVSGYAVIGSCYNRYSGLAILMILFYMIAMPSFFIPATPSNLYYIHTLTGIILDFGMITGLPAIGYILSVTYLKKEVGHADIIKNVAYKLGRAYLVMSFVVLAVGGIMQLAQ